MFGSSGAVETDDVNAHAFENRERGVDVGAEQHASRRVERDLRLNGQINLRLFKGLMQTRDRGFDFEDVLRCFDEQKINAASYQTDSLLGERGDQLIVCDV